MNEELPDTTADTIAQQDAASDDYTGESVKVLKDAAHIRKAVENNSEESKRFLKGIRDLGYAATDTWANFLYCDLGESANRFAQRLELEGITVRALDQWGAPQAIRITIGTPEQNDTLLTALRKLKRP